MIDKCEIAGGRWDSTKRPEPMLIVTDTTSPYMNRIKLI